MISEEQHAWLKSTLKINVKHAEVETDVGNEQGFIPKAVGDSYEGENTKLKWRAGSLERKDGESDADYAARMKRREDGDVVTRYLTEDEKAVARRTVDEKGMVRTPADARANGEFIYVTDPETGDMFVNIEGETGLRNLDASGQPAGDLIIPAHMTPAMNRALQAQARASGGTQRFEWTHHSSALHGGDVASAGTVKFEGGKVKHITNASGHYKPQFKHLLQVVEQLLANGAMLDTEVVDHKGEAIKETQPLAYDLYRKVTPMIAELPAERVKLTKLQEKLDAGDLDEADKAQVDALIEAATKKLETVQKAMLALAKMGIGPRNAMSDDTTVGVKNIRADMTGAEAHALDTDTMSVADFVMGRGASEAIEESREARDAEDEDDDASVDGLFAAGGDGVEADDPYAELNAQLAAGAAVGGAPGPYDNPADRGAYGVPIELGLDEDSSDDEEEEEKVPYRDFAAKGAMLDQLHKVAEERKLRPEDRDDAAETVKEGQAAEVDQDDWEDEIEALTDALDELEGGDEDEDGDLEASAELEVDADGYAIPAFARNADDSGDSKDDEEDEYDERGYAISTLKDEAEKAPTGPVQYDDVPDGAVPGDDAPDDSEEYDEVDADGYATFKPSEDRA